MKEVTNSTRDVPVNNQRTTMVSLCKEFHQLGWMTGTGGAISMRQGEDILITPSGVLKEKVKEDDIFKVNTDGDILKHPDNSSLKYSSCFPNFQHIYSLRPNTTAIYHTHSPMAVLASLTVTGSKLDIKHLHMVKGMRGHGWEDTLSIPIIENKATEDAIADVIEHAVRDNPQVDAVLIRRHGLYVWGETWEMAKVHAESLDWLFKVCIEMKKMGLSLTEQSNQ